MARFGRRSTGDPVAPRVVTGTLGDPGDDDRLEVTFRISDDDVQLTAGDREIGSWPLAEVSMTTGGSELWYFEAEGDRLPFVPTRPAALEASALVRRPDADARRARMPWLGRSRRARRSTTSAPDPRPVEGPASVAPPSEAPAPEAPAPEAPKAPPRDVTAEPHPGDPPPFESTAAQSTPAESTPAESTSATRSAADSAGRSAPPTSAPDQATRGRLWLRTVDTARRRGWFGLDRLPVDESDRDGPHQHTWDHPAAASSGPAQHVCTICGAIRR